MEKVFDHTPHEVFVELSELQVVGKKGFEWKERARWIKYEENVVGPEDRWGNPHVPVLNYNSIFQLIKLLEKGSVILDLDEYEVPGVVEYVVNHMVTCNQIPFAQKEELTKLLLLRHSHVKEHDGVRRRASRTLHTLGITQERKISTPSAENGQARVSLGNIFHESAEESSSRKNSLAAHNGEHSNGRRKTFAFIDFEMGGNSRDKTVINTEILRKLPEGAEAASILVGEVDYLDQPVIAFVRLAEGTFMDKLIEVPIPLRFLVVILGPFGAMDYYEVGRSMASLLSEKYFSEIAYKAITRNQLLTGINEILNASLVIPPSACISKDLIDVDELRTKTQEMKRRTTSVRRKKMVAQEKKAKAIIDPFALDDGEGKKGMIIDTTKRDPLKRKGKLFYGLIQDIKFRHSEYLSDLKDGISLQVLSATLFIFFAALSPAVTFGGMYAARTDNYIGVGETLLVSSINGIIFALLAAQPILIIGSTGPLMIFDMSLLQFCNTMEIDYLSVRVWVGIWMVVVGLLVDAFEGVAIVKKFTRFTEEIFASLVCLIYIFGAIESMVTIFNKNPLSSFNTPSNFNIDGNTSLVEDIHEAHIMDHELGELNSFNGTDDHVLKPVKGTSTEDQPNTALLSLILMLGTMLIALRLKKFRNSKYLGRSLRRNIGDFGVPIAILLMVLLDYFITGVYTEKLNMPKGLTPSNSAMRGWIINPFGVVTPLPVWSMFAAAPAGLLLFILIFLEENICHLILSKPERCLKKGTGFHLDTLLCCVINIVSGFIGAPFMGPACVRTIAHLSALTVTSSNVAPGESPKIVGCIEQRVSAFVVSLLIGLSVMLYSVLNQVPNAVLLGVFMYMGVSPVEGIHLFQRFILFFMPAKYHHNIPAAKKVRTWKMHMFTAIQLALLCLLWGVSKTPASLCVPFILMCLIPLRMFLLPLLFTNAELIALDGAEQQTSEEIAEEEPDFYDAVHSLPTQIETPHPHEK